MLKDLIATYVGHSDLPARVVSRAISVLGNPMGTINEDHIIWYPIRKDGFRSKQFSYKIKLNAADPKLFKRLDALIRAAVRAWVKRGDSYAIWWTNYGPKSRKAL